MHLPRRNLPRIELTAPASGSGKTMITCGLLQVLKNRGLKPASYKCGPDYIDPMFHRTVLETPTHNLDTFFTDEDTTRYLLGSSAKEADIAVIEGVMGYYDGLGAVSEQASAYDVARVTDSPVILIVSCKGASLSILPIIKGFLTFRENSRIKGVILNRISPMLYPRIKAEIEKELDVQVLGYVPQTDVLNLTSRHLGLVMPSEMQDIRRQLNALAELLEKTLDIDGILALAQSASPIEGRTPQLPVIEGSPVIAVARDEAFCFYYAENLELLERLGAKLVEFSPIHDAAIPPCDGMLLGGGYPELHVEALSGNTAMRESIRAAIAGGLPTMAECGGFMYLLEEMEDMEGRSYPVVGALSGRSYRTDKLGRFGYISLHPHEEDMLTAADDPKEQNQQNTHDDETSGGSGMKERVIRGHEFHYFDSTNNGEAYTAKKPGSPRQWECIHATDTLIAGYPHLYYYANPDMAASFVKTCVDYQRMHQADKE